MNKDGAFVDQRTGPPMVPGALGSAAPVGLTLRAKLALKRMLDLAVAVPACVVLSPFIVATAAAIRLESPGPAFFRQERRGKDFRAFTIFKFRSLRIGVPDPHAGYEMVEADPRITRVGRFLRATSLDELPQLFNVIEGSMSLVGPRPLVEWESRQALEGFSGRFLVKPGITGWSQVVVRNSVDFDARCEKDVDYVRRWGLLFDLAIIAKTPASLLRGDTIYPAK